MSGLAYVALAILFVAVIVEGLVLVGVMRQVGALLLQIRPDVPREVGGGPEIHAVIDSAELALASLGTGVVVAFVSPNCELCTVLHPALQALPTRNPELTTVVAIVYGSDEERIELASELGEVARLDLDYLAERWEIPGTPYVVSLDRGGRVRAKGVVNTIEQLDTMMEIAHLPIEDDRTRVESLDEPPGPSHVEVTETERNRVREEVPA